MSLWKALTTSIKDANELTHSERLLADLEPTMLMVYQLPEDIREYTLLRFLDIRSKVISEKNNWSRNGSLSVAKDFFKEARKNQDFNRKESLAYALAGLWLESSLRNHPKAKTVYDTIENTARLLLGEDLTQGYSVSEIAVKPENPNAINTDAFTDNSSSFGYSKDNPIPCRSSEECEYYLKNLRLSGEEINYYKVQVHRGYNITGMPITEYIVSPKNLYDKRSWRLFFSPYQLKNSTLAPSGLSINI